MPKKFIKRYMPDHKVIREHKHLRIFGTLLHDPNLFHLNRRSVAGAFAVGLFFAWVPVPFQMVLAAALAIPLRVNLPISVALVWTSNPITMPPLFYFAYVLGTWILGVRETNFHFELTFEWLGSGLLAIWQPFLLGCFVMGVTSSLLGYVLIRLLWRLSIVRKLKKKNLLRSKPPLL
jgi:uncharacterized protein (DUF2062 family)